MRNVLICDRGELAKALPLCKEYSFGIEAQAFFDPTACEINPSLLDMYQEKRPSPCERRTDVSWICRLEALVLLFETPLETRTISATR